MFCFFCIVSTKFWNHSFKMMASFLPVGWVEKKCPDYDFKEVRDEPTFEKLLIVLFKDY